MRGKPSQVSWPDLTFFNCQWLGLSGFPNLQLEHLTFHLYLEKSLPPATRLPSPSPGNNQKYGNNHSKYCFVPCLMFCIYGFHSFIILPPAFSLVPVHGTKLLVFYDNLRTGWQAIALLK